MKKLYYVLTLGLLAALAGCTDEAIQDEMPNNGMKTYTSFRATIADDMADTRSHLVNDKKIVFDGYDQVLVIGDNDIAGNHAPYAYNTATGTFIGAPITATRITAFYPSDGFIQYSGTKYIYTIPENATYVLDHFNQSLPMYAVMDGSNVLNFHLTTGVIRIALSGSHELMKLTIRGNNDEQIAGTCDFDVTEDTPTLHMTSAYGGSIVSKEQYYQLEGYDGVQLTSSPTFFDFPIPAITFSKGITVEVELKGLPNPIIKSTSNSFTVERGKMKTFSSFDTDATLQQEADAELSAMKAIWQAFGSPSLSGWGSDDISTWTGVTSENGFVTAIDISGKGVSGTISERIGDLKYLKTLNLSNNEITGNVPASLIKLKKLTSFNVSNNQMDGFVYDEVCFTDWWTALNPTINPQKSGKNLKLGYISSNYTNDGKVTATLQTHTQGNGIPIYISGDAFTDRLQEEFNTLASQAMEHFFSIEPYKTYRTYFDVYRLTKVSKNEGVRDGADLAFNTTFSGNSYVADGDRARNVMRTALGIGAGDPVNDVLTIILLHIQGEAKRAICFFDNFGFGAAIIPVDNNMEKVIHHEAGGHGFACLADEYDSDDTGTTTFPTSEKTVLDSQHVSSFEDPSSNYKYGWNKNVDYDTDPATVQWAEFLKPENATYVTNEGVAAGTWEGAHAKYKKGIYRSTDNSTMRDQFTFDKYNPQSRWLIWRRIMIQGNGLSAEPSFADFKAYDAPNITAPILSVITRNYVEDHHFLLGAPPITEVIK